MVNLERPTKDGKIYKEITIKNFIPVLRDCNIYGQTKLNKTLPFNIHNYSKESVSELIGGLFDTDGYVNLRYNKKRGTAIAEVSISQASRYILEELRLLLQRFGIHGRLRERLPRKSNPIDRNSWFEFTISDSRSLINFAENIKLFPKEKQKRLDEIKKVFSNIKPASAHDGLRTETVTEINRLGVKTIYNLTADNTHTYIANGIITHNTEDADYEGLKDLFYEVDAYNCVGFNNVWDEGMNGTQCGFFIPQSSNMDGTTFNGHELMDANGNTNWEWSTRAILAQREEVFKASDRRAIDRHIAEQPLTPAEACLNISSNIFPLQELTKHLALIRNDKKFSNYRQPGDLNFDENGKVKFTQTNRPKDIRKYRMKPNESTEGQVVIWEHPVDNPPYGLYIAGCDPYDHDKSGTNSLGSVFIYKRIQSFEEYYDIPVAEYTGRPDTANDFYEIVRKLLLYYRATLLYENEKKGLFFYFEKMNCTHLLADQPDIINDIIKDSKVQRKKGIHMNQGIKDWGEGAIRDWLIEEYAPGRKNLTKILSEPLLEELIAYNDDGNFDRVMAFMMVMIYRTELQKIRVKKKESNTTKLFDGPLFAFETRGYSRPEEQDYAAFGMDFGSTSNNLIIV
jgi:hypothetical protein